MSASDLFFEERDSRLDERAIVRVRNLDQILFVRAKRLVVAPHSIGSRADVEEQAGTLAQRVRTREVLQRFFEPTRVVRALASAIEAASLRILLRIDLSRLLRIRERSWQTAKPRTSALAIATTLR